MWCHITHDGHICHNCDRSVTYVTVIVIQLHNVEKVIKDFKIDNII